MADAEQILLYSYHTHPPFITAPGEGLSYQFADELTRQSRGRYRFEVKPMSRSRINKMLRERRHGVVPWVNPVWFKDSQETRYTWGAQILMNDANTVVSHRSKQIDFRGSDSLTRLKLGGIRDHVYKGINYQKDQITRVDAANHIDNIRKLSKQRIDVTIMPESAARYLLSLEGLKQQLYLSPTPHSVYQRRLLITHGDPQLRDELDQMVAAIWRTPRWQEIMSSYR